MPKQYEVTVTYKVFATNEEEATGLALDQRAEIETVDVFDMPTREKLEIDLIPF